MLPLGELTGRWCVGNLGAMETAVIRGPIGPVDATPTPHMLAGVEGGECLGICIVAVCV